MKTYTRQQIHHLIWSVPMRDAAKEFGLSTIATEIIVTGELQYREHEMWLYEDAVRRRGQSFKRQTFGFLRH